MKLEQMHMINSNCNMIAKGFLLCYALGDIPVVVGGECMLHRKSVLPLLFYKYPKMNKKYPDITQENYPKKIRTFVWPARTCQLTLSHNRR